MSNNNLNWQSAASIRSLITSGEASAVDVVESVIAQIEETNPSLNALVSFDKESVLSNAAALDHGRAESPGPLHGVPFAIKEPTSVKGDVLTSGFLPLKGAVGKRDASVVRRLKAAGGLYLGKTNTPEAGYYGGTDGHLYGPTHNPWKPGFTAGGSSGGSAAAVAAGMCPIAEGTDGAGSVRIPAAMCGVVGMKPSLGRIARTEVPGSYQTWAYHGPITRTVEDAALMMDVIVGPDHEDPLSLPRESVNYRTEINKDISGWKIAYSPDLGLGYVDPEVADICARAVEAFQDLGAEVVEATPRWESLESAMWNGVWIPGFAAKYDLLDWKNLRREVDDQLISMMGQAERLTAVDIGRAEYSRGLIWKEYSRFMASYDLLISPTLATAAFPLGQFSPDWLQGQSLQRQLLGWLLTYPFNMLTTPAISVPAGMTADGRPVGLQIAGGHLADAKVLRGAANFERARPWSSTYTQLMPSHAAPAHA